MTSPPTTLDQGQDTRSGSDPLAHVRPLSVGDVLDQALRLYRRHFKTLFLVMLGLQVPIFLARTVPEAATRAVFPAGTDPQVLMTLPMDEMLVGFGVLFVTNLLSVVLITVLAALATGAVVYGGELAWRGDVPTPAGCYRALKDRLGALAGTQLLVLVYMMIGVFVGLLPGGLIMGLGAAATSVVGVVLGALLAVTGIVVVALALYLRWFLVVPAVMLDGVSGPKALSRSATLMSGTVSPGLLGVVKVRASLVLLVVFFVIMIPSMMIGIPKLVLAVSFSSLEAPDVSAIPLLIRLPIEGVELLLAALLTPFSALTVLLFYLDLRIRKEGWDLEVRAHALGAGMASEPAPADETTLAQAAGEPPP